MSLQPHQHSSPEKAADSKPTINAPVSVSSRMVRWLEAQGRYWALAWEEFQRTRGYRWMKASGWLLRLIIFTIFGAGVYQIVAWLLPLMPKLAWLTTLLFIWVIVQECVIHYLARYYERRADEVNAEYAKYLQDYAKAQERRVFLYNTEQAQQLSNQQAAVQAQRRQLETQIERLKEQVRGLTSQLEERNKHRLFLLVNTKRGVPCSSDPWETHESTASLYRNSLTLHPESERQRKSIRFILKADFVCLFENRSSDTVTIRTCTVSLLRQTSRGREKEIRFIQRWPVEVKPITSSPHTLDGWRIEGMTIMPPFMLSRHFEVSGRIGERLDQNCFLRISVDAISHPQIDIDLDVDWQKARDSGRLVRLTPRTSAQYQVRKLTE